jgi:50S ribosomal protein L16 3-hydroxylase
MSSEPAGIEVEGAFWEMFVREHWERRPGVFRGLFFPSQSPLISSTQAFAGVMQACNRWRDGDPAFIRFFLENALVQSHLGKYLPVSDDVTFEAFARRIAPALRGQGFGLTVNGFAHHDFALFTRVRRFLRGLYVRVGMPGDVTDLDVFIGNYRHTPFGIHTDKSSNFCVVFEGRKKFLVWPGPALEARRDLHHSVDFDEVRAQAVVLEGGPGDVIYWPSSYWHIAESGGELSGVMNLSLYLGDHAAQFVDAAPAPPPSPPRSSLGRSNTVPWDPSPVALPAPLEEAVKAACAAERSVPATRRAVLRAWLARTTAYNIHRTMPDVLPMSSLSVEQGIRVRVDVEFPIVAVEHEGFLICSAHGHVIEVPAVPKVIAMIERLNSGEPHEVHALIADTIGPATVHEARIEVGPKDVLTVLESLLAMRAIREIS